MIRRKAERPVSVSENRYGGAGQVMMTAILNAPEELSGKGRLFSHITLKPGCGIGEHVHEGEWEVFYILSGRGQLTNNGEVLALEAGDVHLCPAGHSHGVHNAGTESLEMVALILYA